jgi:hypothetical protein
VGTGFRPGRTQNAHRVRRAVGALRWRRLPGSPPRRCSGMAPRGMLVSLRLAAQCRCVPVNWKVNPHGHSRCVRDPPLVLARFARVVHQFGDRRERIAVDVAAVGSRDLCPLRRRELSALERLATRRSVRAVQRDGDLRCRRPAHSRWPLLPEMALGKTARDVNHAALLLAVVLRAAGARKAEIGNTLIERSTLSRLVVSNNSSFVPWER